jgi:hypothetical protein
MLAQSPYSINFLEGKRNFLPTDVYYTDKYIISKKVGIPFLIAPKIYFGAGNNFDYYEVSNIKGIEYPIKCRGIKKDCGLKFSDKNGNDFITTFKNAKTTSEAYLILRRAYVGI